MVKAGILLPIIDLLHSENTTILEQTALLLSNLSSESELVRRELRYTGLAIPTVSLIKSNLPQLQEQGFSLILRKIILILRKKKKSGARLIANLAWDELNRQELVDAGAASPLKSLITM